MEKINEQYYVGQPLKIKKYPESDEYVYGRYYDNGYSPLNIPEEDENLISIVIPNGFLVACLKQYFEPLNEDDMKILNELEKQHLKPYEPRLIKENGLFYKYYEYKKKTLSCDSSMELSQIEELCSINKNMFGEALSLIISKYFNKEYYFNDIKLTYEGKVSGESKDCDVFQSRYVSVISAKKYPVEYVKQYGNELYEPYIPVKNPLSIFGHADYLTMFEQKPIVFSEDEFLMYFCSSDSYIIKIAKILNGKIIPDIEIFQNKQLYHNEKEVKFDNSKFSFIYDFITAIINYKIENNILDLSDEDMEIILEKYDFESFKTTGEKIKKLEK